MNFQQIILEPEQQDLFIQMVEIVKSIPRDQRMGMFNVKTAAGGGWLTIPSRKSGIHELNDIVDGDLDELSSKGLLRKSYGRKGGEKFVISPEGFQYYDWLMKQQGKPVERIENITIRYLDFEDFRKAYPIAYSKIKDAENMLWSADVKKQYSLIGIRCREAMQEFSDQLYSHVFGETFAGPKDKTVDKVRAVIESKRGEAGGTVQKFLVSLLPFWGTVSDLVQQNVHANEKKGKPINMEDSRRIVFQSMNIMMELHRTFKKI